MGLYIEITRRLEVGDLYETKCFHCGKPVTYLIKEIKDSCESNLEDGTVVYWYYAIVEVQNV